MDTTSPYYYLHLLQVCGVLGAEPMAGNPHELWCRRKTTLRFNKDFGIHRTLPVR